MRRIFQKVFYSAQTPITGHLTFSTTSKLCIEVNPSERERERELRRQILHKYNGMSIPEVNNFEYGHFSSSGINVTAAQYAFRDAGASFNGNVLSSSSWNRVRNLIWFIILTGFALIYFLGRAVLQTSRGLNDLELPLWLASIERRSKHIIFLIQFDEQTKNNLKEEFESVHCLNPFVDFFDWLKTKRPEFGFGIRYTPEVSISTLFALLSNTDSHALMIFVRSFQMSSLKKNESPMQKLDNFIDQVRLSGNVLSGSGNMKAFGGGNVAWTEAAPISYTQTSVAFSEPYDVNPNRILKTSQPDMHETNPFEHTYSDKQYKS